MRRVFALITVLLASGCTLPEHSDPPASSTPPTSPTRSTPVVEGAMSAPIVKMALPLNVSVLDRWVRPSDTIIADADAPAGATVSWFLAPRNPYVPGDDDNLDLVPRSLGLVEPGGVSAEALMSGAGRFSYALASDANVRVNVTVLSTLPHGGAAQVVLVKDSWGLRFDPAETFVGLGESVRVTNRADQRVEFVRADQMIAAAPVGPRARITPPSLLGDYDVLALARDSTDGWGESSVRVVVDSRKPDADVALGPFLGTFQTTLNATTPRSEFAYSFRFSLQNVSLSWTTSTKAPMGVSIRVSLMDVNGTILGKAEGATGHMFVSTAPRNGRVGVEGLSGLDATYRVEGIAMMVLVPPSSLFNS